MPSTGECHWLSLYETPLTRTTDQPSHLMDLPPELRNRIYDFVFEDQAPQDISAFAAKALQPRSAIVAVSRQLRKETLGIQQQAIDQFMRQHTFFISADTLSLESPTNSGFIVPPSPLDLQTLLVEATTSPMLPIRQLELRFELRPPHRDEVLVWWTLAIHANKNGSASAKGRAHKIDGSHQDMSVSWFLDTAREKGVRLTRAGMLPKAQSLDFANVVRVLL